MSFKTKSFLGLLALTLAPMPPDSFPQVVVVPRRHVGDYFVLSRPEVNACNELLRAAKEKLLGENLGIGSFRIEMKEEEDKGRFPLTVRYVSCLPKPMI